uniref:Uncharacterized protein n=1 Tax=Arundo donax TaxID=35708 RepID=A0A0A9VM37_ARUDO
MTMCAMPNSSAKLIACFQFDRGNICQIDSLFHCLQFDKGNVCHMKYFASSGNNTLACIVSDDHAPATKAMATPISSVNICNLRWFPFPQ